MPDHFIQRPDLVACLTIADQPDLSVEIETSRHRMAVYVGDYISTGPMPRPGVRPYYDKEIQTAQRLFDALLGMLPNA